MKKILFGIGVLFFCGIPMVQTQAAVEILQIVVFDWDEATKQLKLISMGSGTVIGKNLVLTNKHVVEHNAKTADFILLCQGEAKETRQVRCNISAGVSALHPTLDAALVKPVSDDIFLIAMKTTTVPRLYLDVVQIVGFPVPTDGLQNFGGNSTLKAFETWAKKQNGPLQIKGDAPTTTRGEITAKAKVKGSEQSYLLTNAKVNFGNSGGAAFDQTGSYIGIPTFKDKEGNALILEYKDLKDWVAENANQKPKYARNALNFYESVSQKSTVSKKKTSRFSARTAKTKNSRKLPIKVSTKK